MENKKTSVFNNGLIWFGAGVSIAEILTGTYYADMGWGAGLSAILIGHVIGCILLFLAGMIGGNTKKSAMETVKMSFGEKGGLLFSFLNIIQLVGWTAIMIYDGALAAGGVWPGIGSGGESGGFGAGIWCLVIGGLIVVWILVGITNLGKINIVAMASLFIMTVIVGVIVFRNGFQISGSGAEAMSFGAAVELAVAMPLSWLPLISDYTREAEKPAAATAVSAVVYGIVSCFMYIIGMGAAALTGQSDIAQILLSCGLGIVGLLIVVLSTVTTTFLDAYSAGVSSVSVWSKINEKWFAVAVTVIGTIAAMVYPMDNITDFLYFIGSVFAPMIAIQIADYFILKSEDASAKSFQIKNLVIWAVGFVLYRYLMTVDIPFGSTLPDMLITMVLCVAVAKVWKMDK